MVPLSAIRHFIIDMDGVLYHGNQPVDGAADFLKAIREHGKRFILLTNNSTMTPGQFRSKLADMSISVSEDRIVTSASATALYLKSVAAPESRVYVIGESGIHSALRETGFTLSDSRIDYVVVGLDRQVTYEKLRIASLAIRGGAAFVATNPDPTLPTEDGLAPGIGSILAAITAATGVTPTVVGKPQRSIFEQALLKLRADTKDTAAIGDRIDTDIVGAHSMGVTTIFLLGGASSEHDLSVSAVKPDYVFPHMRALHRAAFDSAAAGATRSA